MYNEYFENRVAKIESYIDYLTLKGFCKELNFTFFSPWDSDRPFFYFDFEDNGFRISSTRIFLIDEVLTPKELIEGYLTKTNNTF